MENATGALQCNGQEACMFVNFPEPAPLFTDYIILCDSTNQCLYSQIICPKYTKCIIKCTSYAGCAGAVIICPKYADCVIECPGQSSCAYAEIQPPLDGAL
eukprot:550010_1